MSRIRSANNSVDTSNSNDRLFVSGQQQSPFPQQFPRQTTPMQHDSSRSSTSNNGSNDLETSTNFMEDTESLEELLSFDPFKVNLNRQMLMNEFVTDGSLGLLPFLETKQDGSSMDDGLFYNHVDFHVGVNDEEEQSKKPDPGLFNQSNFW